MQILVLLALHHYYFGDSRYFNYIEIKILHSSKRNQTTLEGNTQEKLRIVLKLANSKAVLDQTNDLFNYICVLSLDVLTY